MSKTNFIRISINYFSKVIAFLIAAFGHPLYLFVAFFTGMSFGWYKTVSVNVTKVYPILFIVSLILIALLRYMIFCVIFTRISTDKLFLFNKFLKINLVSLPGLLIFFLLIGDVEGNVFGFIIFPLILIFGIIITPLIFILTVRFRGNLLEQKIINNTDREEMYD